MKFKKIQATKTRLNNVSYQQKTQYSRKKVNAEFKKAQRKFGQNMVQTITSVMVRTTLVPVAVIIIKSGAVEN